MAYDRADESTTRVAEILKADDNNDDLRVMCNVVRELLNRTDAQLASDTVAQIKAFLDTALSR